MCDVAIQGTIASSPCRLIYRDGYADPLAPGLALLTDDDVRMLVGFSSGITETGSIF